MPLNDIYRDKKICRQCSPCKESSIAPIESRCIPLKRKSRKTFHTQVGKPAF